MNAMQPPQSVEEIKAGLETTEKGGVRQSIRNCLTVFQRDPLLSGAIAYNILTDRKDIIKPIGFHRESTALNDTDMKYLLLYLEETYGLTIRDLPPYVFVMIGLYAGLRREEILALKWDCVFLDTETPYLLVRRAWHTESNRPIIMTELKTKAARRDIAIPDRLAECLREAKAASTSEYVIANDDGGPLSYSQFKNLWRFIIVRTAKPRIAKKKVGGKYVKYMLYPELGAMAKNNGKVQYVLDFEVTPHQLRHTYITNLIAAGVDPKTVQYLAGHENSKITMDIYAKAKYNRPEDVAPALADAFAMWNE